MQKPCLKLCDDIVNRLKNKNSHLAPFLSILRASTLIKNSSNETVFTLKLPSTLYKERVEKNYSQIFEKEISTVHKSPFRFEVIVSEKKQKPIIIKKKLSTQKIKVQKKEAKNYLFNPSFVFKNFVSGSSNPVVLNFFKGLAQNPNSCSSVFIFGKTGCGKTHLLQAFCQEVLEKNPHFPLLYFSGEKFLQECVSSIRTNQFENFQKKFQNNCQVLIIDDLQGIEKGFRSQEEFFHTFNALTEKGGLVICSCDRLPSEIKKLQNRIQTRLSGGIVLRINSSDLETRTEILSQKAKQKKLLLSQTILKFLAERSENISTRETEGWLNKIKMVCDLSKGKPSLEMVRDILSPHISPFSQTPQGYVQHLAQKNGLSYEKLISSTRTQDVVFVRNKAMYLVREKFPYLSLSQIGNLFGRRSHSTVLHGLKKAQSDKKSIYL